MISLLLIIFYAFIFTFWLLKISRSYRNYFSAQQVIFSFVIKLLFGFAYGYLFWKFYKGDDTWLYHNQSLAEYQNLLHHPRIFFSDLTSKATGSNSLQSIYNTTGSFWNKLDDFLFIKLLAIFDVFSFGHYYVNVVLFCFLVFLGHLLLFRLLVQHYPQSARLFSLVIFFDPMIVFWLSGIRKEGIIFLALALVLFYCNRLNESNKKIIVNILLIAVGLTMILLMRNFVFMCLVPSLIGWILYRRTKWSAPLCFAIVYLGCIVLFFTSGHIPGLPDLAEKVTQRQYEYLDLTANTRLALDSLKSTPFSYLKVLPQAINHSFVRPYITEAKGILQIFSALDVLLFFAVAALSFFSRQSNWQKILKDKVILTFLFTSTSAYLLIGYTVPYPGTFVRYKSIFELLFLCAFVACADEKKIAYFGINKN